MFTRAIRIKLALGAFGSVVIGMLGTLAFRQKNELSNVEPNKKPTLNTDTNDPFIRSKNCEPIKHSNKIFICSGSGNRPLSEGIQVI